MQCFHYNEYGHTNRDCLEHADRKKSNDLSTMLLEEHEEYIRDILTSSKSMDTIYHDE